MRHPIIILALLAALILCCGCTGTTADPATATPAATGAASTPTAQVHDYTFTQTITYSNENGTTVLAKNKIAKTATLDITMHIESAPSGFNQTAYNELITAVAAGVMQMALFNETALTEFNAQVEEWNSQEYTIEDDSPPEQVETAPAENPLEGYTVTRATIRLFEQGTEAGIANIMITGPNKEDVAITYP